MKLYLRNFFWKNVYLKYAWFLQITFTNRTFQQFVFAEFLMDITNVCGKQKNLFSLQLNGYFLRVFLTMKMCVFDFL